MIADWLALPGEEQLFLVQEQPAAQKIPELPDLLHDLDTPPTVSSGALVASSRVSAERAEFARAWRCLTRRQRAYIRALQRNNFRHPAALKIANNATAGEGERKIQWSTPSRWARDDHEYKVVLAAVKSDAAAHVVTRDDLLLRAHRIAELAEDGEPVYGVDRAEGGMKLLGHERKLDTALRANEQIAKITKVLGGEERGNGGAVGPALIIQVVQRDGGLVDATPKGVTIDLPVPSGR